MEKEQIREPPNNPKYIQYTNFTRHQEYTMGKGWFSINGIGETGNAYTNEINYTPILHHAQRSTQGRLKILR